VKAAPRQAVQACWKVGFEYRAGLAAMQLLVSHRYKMVMCTTL